MSRLKEALTIHKSSERESAKAVRDLLYVFLLTVFCWLDGATRVERLDKYTDHIDDFFRTQSNMVNTQVRMVVKLDIGAMYGLIVPYILVIGENKYVTSPVKFYVEGRFTNRYYFIDGQPSFGDTDIKITSESANIYTISDMFMFRQPVVASLKSNLHFIITGFNPLTQGFDLVIGEKKMRPIVVDTTDLVFSNTGDTTVVVHKEGNKFSAKADDMFFSVKSIHLCDGDYDFKF